jgi:hypothetical protein
MRRIGELGTTLAVTTEARCEEIFLRCLHLLLFTVSVVPSSQILLTLMKMALSSCETSVLTRTTRRNFSEDAILHSHRRENLKSYILRNVWVLHQLEISNFAEHTPVYIDRTQELRLHFKGEIPQMLI